jgi:uncharacterized membrane protein YadS
LVKDETAGFHVRVDGAHPAVPTFIVRLVVVAAANTAGVIGSHTMRELKLGRVVMIVARIVVALHRL